ncbi:unnamed protein product [Phaedon cochleariae]|uniref:C-type lectin domain-containing protein n=1 Tax=Phaedon cochleariae TaxID=80249 RepID=A0A9N9X3M5_PHACE|nr:unnamed protein product [Phaedon cochleariae]
MSAETIQTTYVCPANFIAVDKKCYHFSTKEVPWTESHFHCQLSNGSLTVINSYRENNQLRGYLSTGNGSSLALNEYWLDGIYDWEQKMWKWGSTGQNIQFNKFSRNNIGDKYKWKCVSLHGARNKWMARKCTKRKRFICQTDSNIFVQFQHVDEKYKEFDISKCSDKNLKKFEQKKCLELLDNLENNEPAAYVKVLSGNRNSTKYRYVAKVEGQIDENDYNVLGLKSLDTTKMAFKIVPNDSFTVSLEDIIAILEAPAKRHERWIGGIFDWKTKMWRWAMTGKPITYNGFHSEAINREKSGELSWNSIFMDPKWDNHWNADKQTEKKWFICQMKAQAVKNLGSPRISQPRAVIHNLVP